MKVNFVPIPLGQVSFLPTGQLAGGTLPSGAPAPVSDDDISPVTITPQQSGPAAGPFFNTDALNSQNEYANSLLEASGNTAPARGGLAEGFSRLAEGLAGGLLKHNATEGLKNAKAQNNAALLDAFQNGDISKLLTSNDPTADKLGSAILEQQLKKQPGTYKTLENGTVVWQANQGGAPTIVSRPTTGLPKGFRWNADGSDLEYIPGGPADPSVIKTDSGDRRVPPKAAAPDQTGIAPWLRKW